MNGASVKALLGEPAGVDREVHIHHQPHPEGDRYFRLPMNGDRYSGFMKDWRALGAEL